MSELSLCMDEDQITVFGMQNIFVHTKMLLYYFINDLCRLPPILGTLDHQEAERSPHPAAAAAVVVVQAPAA